MDTYRTGRHVIYDLHVHLVLVTKYRKGVITPRVDRLLKETTQEICTNLNVGIEAMETEHDHMHLLLSLPTTVSVAHVVNVLKSNTSKRVRETGWSETRRTGPKHFWSPSYFAATTGGATLQTLRAYVENQRQPNKQGRPTSVRA